MRERRKMCDELKAMKVIDAYQLECDDNDLVYRKSEVDKVIAEKDKEIAELKEEVNEQTFKLCVEKENVCQLEQLFQKQKDRADKLFHCLRCLVMRDLIKDCSEKESATEIIKEFK